MPLQSTLVPSFNPLHEPCAMFNCLALWWGGWGNFGHHCDVSASSIAWHVLNLIVSTTCLGRWLPGPSECMECVPIRGPRLRQTSTRASSVSEVHLYAPWSTCSLLLDTSLIPFQEAYDILSPLVHNDPNLILQILNLIKAGITGVSKLSF